MLNLLCIQEIELFNYEIAEIFQIKSNKINMLKYLNNISRKLTGIKRGMETNEASWKHAPENSAFVDSVLNEINEKGREIENLKQILSQKYAEARALSLEKKIVLSRIEKRAIGIHADSPEKLNEYGINN